VDTGTDRSSGIALIIDTHCFAEDLEDTVLAGALGRVFRAGR
jgi:hypothetical protein